MFKSHLTIIIIIFFTIFTEARIQINESPNNTSKYFIYEDSYTNLNNINHLFNTSKIIKTGSTHNQLSIGKNYLQFGKNNNPKDKAFLKTNFTVDGNIYDLRSTKVFIAFTAARIGGNRNSATINIKLNNQNKNLVLTNTEFKEFYLEFDITETNINSLEISQLSDKGFYLQNISISNALYYNGEKWTGNITPNVTHNGIFNNSTPINWTGILELKKLIIESNTQVTVNSNSIIKIIEELNVNSNSSLTFLPNAYLKQEQNTKNIGKVTFLRNATLYRYDTNTWSSPVENQNLQNFSSKTVRTRFYNYNTVKDAWDNSNINANTNFEIGVGYGIYAPNNFPIFNSKNLVNNPEVFTGTFHGKPNTGDVKLRLDTSNSLYNFFLIGNPYPSPIDLSQLIEDNPDIEDIQIYTHKVPVDMANGKYHTNDSNYDLINRAGTNYISTRGIADVGQAFFIKLNDNIKTSNYELTISNKLRDYNKENSPIAFKTKNKENSRTVDDKLWLELLGENDRKISSTLIGFSKITTDNYDAGYDGLALDGNTANGLYSLLNKDKYIIQTLGDYDTNKKVPLNLKVEKEGNYTIKLGKAIGILTKDNILMYDTLEQKLIDFNANDTYTFYTKEGDFSDRFIIQFKKNNTINEEITTNKEEIQIYTSNKSLIIKPIIKENISVKIYSRDGILIREFNNVNDLNTPLTTGIYFLVINTNNKTINKKILIN